MNNSHKTAAHDDAPSAPEFVALFLAEQRRIFCYIVTLLGNTQEAEDLLQETATVLWKKFDEFQPGTSFFSWACQTAQYHVLNYRRKHERQMVLLDDDVLELLADVPTAEGEILTIRRDALHTCLDKLSSSDRKLFEVRYASTMAVKDMAAKFGRSADSVGHSLGRIRRALIECIRRALAIAGREGGRS